MQNFGGQTRSIMGDVELANGKIVEGLERFSLNTHSIH